MDDDPIKTKSELYAIRCVRLGVYLKKVQGEHNIANQVIRSGTSIGANIAESKGTPSRADFINKLHIALKEAKETLYWITILAESGLIPRNGASSMERDCVEIIKLITASINTARKNKNP